MISLILCMAAAAPQTDTASAAPTVITLEQALQIALNENASVKVADKEIVRTGYARKGSYAALYPTISGTGSFQRTIKKQVMYMDGDLKKVMGGGSTETNAEQGTSGTTSGSTAPSESGGFEVGRSNTWSAGLSANMPLVNAQLWKSLRISDQDVELAVEKARASRLDMVTEVKETYFACLLARDAFNVYKSVYDNAVENLERTQKKYNAQKASELDLTRAKTNVANAIPNVYDAENSILLSLWQLKAVMGVSLDENIDVAGELDDYAQHMLYDIEANDNLDLANNSTMRQLAIQAEQLANTVKLQKYASIPNLSLGFSYSFNAVANDFKFSQYQWNPYSYVGLSLSIPIFSGGSRHYAVKQAQVQSTELQIQRANTERQLKISIRQYLNSMETAMKSYSAALSAVETAEKAYNIAEKSYNVGRSTLTDLNDAQLSLVQSQLTVSQAVYSFVVAKANLEGILGADFIDEDGNVTLNKTYNNE